MVLSKTSCTFGRTAETEAKAAGCTAPESPGSRKPPSAVEGAGGKESMRDGMGGSQTTGTAETNYNSDARDTRPWFIHGKSTRWQH